MITQNVQEKAVHFYGLPPGKILEASSIAINFWEFQRRTHLKIISDHAVSRGEVEELQKARAADADTIRRLEEEVSRGKAINQRLEARLEAEMRDKENIAANSQYHRRSPAPQDRFGTLPYRNSSPAPPAQFAEPTKYRSEGFFSSSIPTPRMETEGFRTSNPAVEREMVPFDSHSRTHQGQGYSSSPQHSSRFLAQLTPRGQFKPTSATPTAQTLFSSSRSSSVSKSRSYFK
jgi:hypothetical protein